jgi:hypothetical protein
MKRLWRWYIYKRGLFRLRNGWCPQCYKGVDPLCDICIGRRWDRGYVLDLHQHWEYLGLWHAWYYDGVGKK